MQNIPKVKLGLIAVSRDCFPIELSKSRREKVISSCNEKKIDIIEIETIVENEKDVIKALDEIKNKNINALAIFLGNFGPEGPTSLLAQKFDGPIMISAAAEETQNNLFQGRGDAYCGLLSASYNLGMRKEKVYIPEYPIGNANQTAEFIREFIPIARVLIGVKNLKIISFGPRPHDFLACNAPIQPLYDLGVEIMENSELDLLDIVEAEKDNPRIKEVAEEMAKELGSGNTYPGLLNKLAQYEIAIEKFIEENKGASKYVALASKCWPAFEKYFTHVPCFVNARLAARGIPVACEADIYGALSEYMSICATEKPPAILDINNSVPEDMFEQNKELFKDYKLSDLWMGFHCGNASSVCMINPVMKHQVIMHRLMEPESKPNITRGTLEGQIKSGPVSIFRMQGTSDANTQAYIAEGEVIDIDPKTFGSTGVFAIKEMGRFYRHILLEKHFPHHTVIAFAHAGKTLFAASKLLTEKVYYNKPKGDTYQNENPFPR